MLLRPRFLFPVSLALLLAACGGAPEDAGPETPSPAAEPAAQATPPVAANDVDVVDSAGTAGRATPDWDNLGELVGKYQRDLDLRAQTPLLAALRELLGDKVVALRRNLQVAGPLSEEAGVYYMTGNAPHEGGAEQAWIMVEPATHAIEVGLREGSVLEVYRTPGSSIARPADVRTMIANVGETP